MAGDWIKVEKTTPDKPEILRIARLLGIDKDAAFGKLVRIWGWFDGNSVDGHVDGVVEDDVDSIVSCKGFARAMKTVFWMDFDNEAQWVQLPKFDRHNGETAKKRALKNESQAKWRANKVKNVDDEQSTNVSTSQSTKVTTREEKRREEKSIKPFLSGTGNSMGEAA